MSSLILKGPWLLRDLHSKTAAMHHSIPSEIPPACHLQPQRAYHIWPWHPLPTGVSHRMLFPCVRVCVCVLVAQSCPTLCDPMGCSPPASSVHGILQARILEWIAIPFSRGSSRPRDQTLVSFIAGRFFTIWVIGKSLFPSRSPLC